MADNETPEVTPDESAERLLAVGAEVRKRRGRPPGSKNKPKDGDSGIKVNETNQKRIFAGALIALFSLLGIILGWFGYEYYQRMTMERAEEGGTYLLPISQKIGWIASVAFYLSFPIWLLTNINDSFRKKVETPNPADAPPASPVNGVSRAPVGNSVSEGAPSFVDSPPDGEPGFTPLQN